MALPNGAQLCLIATRWILPERAVFQFFLFRGKVIPPAQYFEQVGGKLGVPVLDLVTHQIGAVGQQAYLLALHPEAGAEVEFAFGYRSTGVIQVRGSGVSQLRGTPARPGQVIVLAGGGAALGLQGGEVEGVPVLLVALQPLRAVAGITDGPHATVELAGDVPDQGLLALDLDVFEQLIAEAELLGQLVHDGVVRQCLEQGFDHLERMIEGRFLTSPDPVFHLGVNVVFLTSNQ